ncbi:chlorophyll synthase ChlG [Pararhizobium mangrovi]|uniref:Chlorophyll synthase ChlG n=1 Tax=Pararhizobium mangrovi TaxID=2590452 RepID=A0A506U9B4_9HYPH|nr:chlorophyll synthase ChlG [Pararhizobium mangrovi]
MRSLSASVSGPPFSPATVIELAKPVTWFAPMWAFMCGSVSAGLSRGDAPMAFAGVVLAGPLLCATSQIVNEWYDRDVDAINQPERPIPSGRIPGRWGLALAVVASVVSLAFAALLGPVVLWGALAGLVLAWAYSAPPLRLKRNGWYGNAAVAISYEGLAWFTGAAVIAGGVPDGHILVLAALYSLGAHGIMTLNDFKSVAGDRASGIRSLPARYGVQGAARIACALMAGAQVAVCIALFVWGAPMHAAIVAAMLVVQVGLMRRLMKDCAGRAAWYNATGTSLYVLGMLVSALAVSAG